MFKMAEDRQLGIVGGSSPLLPRTRLFEPGNHRVWLNNRRLCDVVLEVADRNRRWVWLTVLVFYLAAFNGQWRMQSDAALYLSIGRNLALGKGFTYLGQTDHLAYPGWPALIAITFKIFGTKSLLPVHVLALLIALMTLVAVYRLFLLHSGRPTAVVVCAGVGLTKAFFCYGFELWTDMLFALGVMIFLAGYEGVLQRREPSGRRSIAGLLNQILLIGGLIIAGATRPTIWPLLAALTMALVFLAIKRQLRWTKLLILFTAVLMLIAICFAFDWIRASHDGFGAVYKDFFMKRIGGGPGDGLTHSIRQNTRDLFRWAASDVLFQTRLGPVCNALLSLVVVSLGVGLFRHRALWGFWFCLLLATILVSQETLDRYFLPVLPLLVFAWWDMLVRLNRAVPIQLGNVLFLFLVSFGGLMNLTKCIGIISQQHQRPFLASYDKGTFDVIPEFAQRLHDSVGDDAIVLVKWPYGRVTAFISERCVTNPLSTTVNELQHHPVYVVEPSDAATHNLLKTARLTEQPVMFTVCPSPEHGPNAIPLSLHATRIAE